MAFAYCKKLSDVELNDRLQKIGANAFTSTALTSVTLPASVISIGGEQGDVVRGRRYSTIVLRSNESG